MSVMVGVSVLLEIFAGVMLLSLEADEAVDVKVTDLLQGGVDELFQVNVCVTVVLRHSYPISSFSPCDEDALGKLWDR